MKNNPWLDIPASDYENHMLEVGQSQILSTLTKKYLEKYKPERFALLGCATGNGLEHINPYITKKVFAIDVNADYLKKTNERFTNEIPGLEVIQWDIQNEGPGFKDVNLVFAGLILEYVDVKNAIMKIADTLAARGVLIIVIQRSRGTSFVSKTKYCSLEKLSGIAHEADENEIDCITQIAGLKMLHREEIELNPQKSFVLLEYISNY